MAGRAMPSLLTYELDRPLPIERGIDSAGSLARDRPLRKKDKGLRGSIVALAVFAAAAAAVFLVSRCALHLWRAEGSNARRLAEGHKWPSLQELCEENDWIGDSDIHEDVSSDDEEPAGGVPRPPTPPASVAVGTSLYSFPTIPDANGGRHARGSLKAVLTFLQGLATTDDAAKQQKAAGIINVTFEGVTVKIFIEKVGGPPGWPSTRTIMEAARRLETGFNRVVQSAKRQEQFSICAICDANCDDFPLLQHYWQCRLRASGRVLQELEEK
ncbi:hypothetical protein, conserved [Eimeria brunetti]|uniref:Uncharacterized protein n=1 Tax=Eimeria brunetti TaxID=51314 RepID=U6M0I7_9EIME|nr:hypothetical protein, conserved [Eimeria brunetti]